MGYTRDEAVDTLKEFLSLPVSSTSQVFEKFKTLERHIFHDRGDTRFLYVPGTREDRVVLVAHADTVWDGMNFSQQVLFDEGIFYGKNRSAGIGADDRAGCAILWMLRNSGHSLLITDGEEIGQTGAHFLVEDFLTLSEEINSSRYMLEFDRRNGRDYKVYQIPVTQEFKDYIEKNTGFSEPDKIARTDIITLCKKICGANLSMGCYREHTPDEHLILSEWLNVLEIAERMLSGEQPQFPLR